jgi:hypothetical protein
MYSLHNVLIAEDETQFAICMRLLYMCTICYTGPYQLYSEYKIFSEIPSKRNRVLESDSEKEEQRQTVD